ncbi:CAAX amino terminal protease self- immunity [Planctomycetes bacterium CA13]|uniref:CAAX amino terminal protease self-immunity n=1 Tax=Novipirellula herctigrandis TaxID=2527986 RepID=A0A5C5YY58_9BACT|nr:CAAX amino terminal protease self- immunity [Planctomycetes bacterium CA13]
MSNHTEPTCPNDHTSDSLNIGNAAEKSPVDLKPRVWPLFAISLAEVVFISILQGAFILAFLFATRGDGQSLQEAVRGLPSRLMHPPLFLLMLCLSGFSMIGFAFLFGRMSAKHRHISTIERLGLQWPTIPLTSFLCLMIGSVPVLLISVGIVMLINMVLPGDETGLALYKDITNGWAVALIVLIGVLPGFGEELFFRGFIQRRMLQRYRPSVAIGVTSALFGLFHVTPHGIALATIIGVWLGVIAWRTNSIWPSVCCHAFINSGWNIYQVGRFNWGFPDVPPIWFGIVGSAVVLAAFAISVRILRTQDPNLDQLRSEFA